VWDGYNRLTVAAARKTMAWRLLEVEFTVIEGRININDANNALRFNEDLSAINGC
jgi:hypothetical protein